MILGIDVGGVIIDRKRNDNTDTSLLGPHYLSAYEVPGAFETINLVRPRFSQVFIVSKCGVNVERKTREWMKYNYFHEKAGIPEASLRFCRTRADKAPICAALGITHFIDDRLEVLSYLKSVTNKYLFSPNPREVDAFKEHLPQVTVVGAWKELTDLLR